MTGRLFERIRLAVREDRFLVSRHADERAEERDVAVWQLVPGLEEVKLERERPASKPHASIVVREELADGTSVEAIWAWLPESHRAMLVTVYFPE